MTAFAAEKTQEQIDQEANRIFGIDGVQQKTFHKLVASGTTTKVAWFGDINPDCTSKNSTVRITKQPEHGTIEAVQNQDYLAWPKDTFRYKCGQHKVQVHQIKYKSADKYTGKDEADVLVLWDGGYAWEVHLDIDVR